MPGEISTAYVRIRPNMTGFKSEVQGGVRDSFHGVKKIIGTALAVGGAFELVKSIASAAAEREASLATLRTSLRATGAAEKVHGETVVEALDKIAAHGKSTFPEITQGFIRLVTVTNDSAKAVKDLGIAENIAIARHIGVSEAALTLARAEGGNMQSLRRLGITIPAVTTEQDKLTRARDEAIKQGAKFTTGQRTEIQEMLRRAKADDKAASTVNILSQVQAKFAGQTKAFSQTAAGQYASFQRAIRGLKIELGSALLPTLTEAGRGLTEWINGLRETNDMQDAVRATAEGVATTYETTKGILQAIAPPIVAVARAIHTVASEIGGKEIITALLVYKGLKLVLGGVEIAADLWREAMLSGAAATKASTSAQAVSTTGLQANTTAQAENTVVRNAASVSMARYVAELTALNVAQENENRLALFGGGVAARNASGRFTRPPAPLFGGGVAARGEGGRFVSGGMSVAQQAAFNSNVERQIKLFGGGAAGARAYQASLTRLVAAQSLGSAGNYRLAASLFTVEKSAASSAGGIRTFLTGVGRMGMGAAGGPVGLAIIGVAALATGIYYLHSRQSAASKANDAYRSSLSSLDEVLVKIAEDVKHLNDVQNTLPTLSLAKQTAILGVAQAENNLKTSKAASGSLEYKQLLNSVAQAKDQLRQATVALTDAETEADKARSGINAHRAAELVIARNAASDAIRIGNQAKDEARNSAKNGAEFDKTVESLGRGWNQYTVAQAAAIVGAKTFTTWLAQNAEKLQKEHPLVARNTRILSEYTQAIGRIPSRKTITFLLSLPQKGEGVAGVVAMIQNAVAEAQITARKGGALIADELAGGLSARVLAALTKARKTGVSFAQAMIAGADTEALRLTGLANSAAAEGQNDTALAAAEASSKASKAAAAEAKRVLNAAKQQVADAVENFQSAKEAVQLAQQSLADTIRQGQQSITDAVNSAKQNLNTIGDSLAQSIADFFDKTAKKGGAGKLTGPLLERYKELKAAIAAGRDDPETRRAAAELSAELQARAAATAADTSKITEKKKARVKRELADLTDLRNKGAITEEQFEKRLSKLLEKEGITRKNIRKALGIAAADEFSAEVSGLKAQGRANAAGPQRPGTGLLPQIIKPLDAVVASNKAIATAERELKHAGQAEARAARALANKQLNEARAQTKELQKIHAAQRAEQFFLEHGRPKPKGKAKRDAEDVAAAGAGSRP